MMTEFEVLAKFLLNLILSPVSQFIVPTGQHAPPGGKLSWDNLPLGLQTVL